MLLTACAAPVTDSGSTEVGPADTAADTGSGDDTDPTDPVEPLTAEEAAQLAEAAFAAGLPHTRDLFQPVAELLAAGDEACPGVDGQIDGPLEGCTSTSGYEYLGVLEFSEEVVESGEVSTHSFAIHNGNFVIVPPEGAPFRAACGWEWRAIDSPGSVAVTESYVGTLEYEDAEDPFLRAGLSIYGTFRAERTAASGDLLTLSHSMGWGEHAVRTDALRLEWQACPSQPVSGSLDVRHPDGRWASATFDGSCDCPVWVDPGGVELGRACPELSSVLQASFERMVEIQ